MDKVQKEWLLKTFFKNEKFPGWRGIAEKLIDTGKCVTTGNIWIGGIGNFIESEKYEGGIDLIELSFDVELFCSKMNAYFMEYHLAEVRKIKQEMFELTKRQSSIKSIIN